MAHAISLATNERLLSGLSNAPHRPGEHAVLRLTTKASSVQRMTPLLCTLFAQKPIPVAVQGEFLMGVFTGKAADFNAKWRIHEQIESARSSKIDDSELNGASASKDTVKSSKKISPTYHRRRKTRVYFPL